MRPRRKADRRSFRHRNSRPEHPQTRSEERVVPPALFAPGPLLARHDQSVALVGLKGDLGALVLGVLVAGHGKADELAKTMLGFKDLFLLGFFLSIGPSGSLTMETVLVGAAITPSTRSIW